MVITLVVVVMIAVVISVNVFAIMAPAVTDRFKLFHLLFNLFECIGVFYAAILFQLQHTAAARRFPRPAGPLAR